jgi:hypothetical protein
LKRRVQRRLASGALDVAAIERRIGGVLRSRSTSNGVELTLLDFDDARETDLRTMCATLSDAQPPSLEDLFIELTTDRAARALGALRGGAA